MVKSLRDRGTRATGADRHPTSAVSPSDAEHLDPEQESTDRWFLDWARQSPAWLTSMIVHMILILLLALLTFTTMIDDKTYELTIQPNDPTKVADVDSKDPFEAPKVSDAGPVAKNIPQIQDFKMQLPTTQDVNIASSQPTDLPQVPVGLPPGPNLPSGAKNGYDDLIAKGGPIDQRRNIFNDGPGGDSDLGDGGRDALKAALEWIAAHQLRDGSWDFRLTAGPCSRGTCSGEGTIDAKRGATGLALLTFLGAGQTQLEGDYQKVVEKGLAWLVRNMKMQGTLGLLADEGHAHMYAHGIASMALVEAYGMTKDNRLMAPAQMALNYIHHAQDPVGGGWRYSPREKGDTSAFGWQIMAIKSGQMAYLKVDKKSYELASVFLDSVQSEYGAKYGYTDPGHKATTTAIGLLCRMYLGWEPDHPALESGIAYLGQRGPMTDQNSGEAMYYNYYATQAVFQYTSGEGPMWEKWNVAMRDYLIASQDNRGAEEGSWHHGAPTNWGGRLYDTTLSALTLEVHYRYLPIYKSAARTDPFVNEALLE